MPTSRPSVPITALADPSFGLRLAELRHGAGFTQRDLAVRSGVSERTIARIETDGNGAPRNTTVRMLVGGLNLAPAAAHWLSTGEGAAHLEPVLTSTAGAPMIGREDDLRDLLDLLANPSLRT
ncbi:MAG: helix-turn-helix domain-containing protein, partial [Thermomicrobiales bacterium]